LEKEQKKRRKLKNIQMKRLDSRAESSCWSEGADSKNLTVRFSPHQSKLRLRQSLSISQGEEQTKVR
jgi:hypothetical protein